MFSPLFTLLIASEFCYYLLIAQTGIVELFNSDVSTFFTLPIGGILGSLLVYVPWKYLSSDTQKMTVMVLIQLFGSLFYPHLNLFVLGYWD